jgi:DNA replication protein DnaC
MNEALVKTLKLLKLSGLAQSLDIRLHEAQLNQLTHAEFLELLLQDEVHIRGERRLGRRVKAAAFRELKTFEAFDWTFNTSLPKKHILDLATGRFLREHRDILFVGPPDTGKNHLARAFGYQAIKLGHAVW